MAAEIGLSRSRFEHLYKETFGISVNRDRIRARVKRAAELLTSGDLPVSQIGALVGYRSTAYFCNQFKAAYGMTPEEYRAQPSRA